MKPYNLNPFSPIRIKQLPEINPDASKFKSILDALEVARAVVMARDKLADQQDILNQSDQISRDPDIVDIRHLHPDHNKSAGEVSIVPSSSSNASELKEYLDSIRPAQPSHVKLIVDEPVTIVHRQNIG